MALVLLVCRPSAAFPANRRASPQSPIATASARRPEPPLVGAIPRNDRDEPAVLAGVSLPLRKTDSNPITTGPGSGYELVAWMNSRRAVPISLGESSWR